MPPISTHATFRGVVIVGLPPRWHEQSSEIRPPLASGGYEVSEQDGAPGRNDKAEFPARGTTLRQTPGAGRVQPRRRSPVDPAALREGIEGRDQARNRRAAGNHLVYRERRNDVRRGGHHATQARSHRAGRLRASNLRSGPHRPAKAPAACFPRESPLEPADHRRDAKPPPPMLNELRSNSSLPCWWHFPTSGIFCAGTTIGDGAGNGLAARQSERFKNPFMAECRFLV